MPSIPSGELSLVLVGRPERIVQQGSEDLELFGDSDLIFSPTSSSATRT